MTITPSHPLAPLHAQSRWYNQKFDAIAGYRAAIHPPPNFGDSKQISLGIQCWWWSTKIPPMKVSKGFPVKNGNFPLQTDHRSVMRGFYTSSCVNGTHSPATHQGRTPCPDLSYESSIKEVQGDDWDVDDLQLCSSSIFAGFDGEMDRNGSLIHEWMNFHWLSFTNPFIMLTDVWN